MDRLERAIVQNRRQNKSIIDRPLVGLNKLPRPAATRTSPVLNEQLREAEADRNEVARDRHLVAQVHAQALVDIQIMMIVAGLRVLIYQGRTTMEQGLERVYRLHGARVRIRVEKELKKRSPMTDEEFGKAIAMHLRQMPMTAPYDFEEREGTAGG